MTKDKRRTVRYFQVDVFTGEPFRGNPAGVVLDAAGLTDDQMQAIAREVNNSETAFIFPPSETVPVGVPVRFFTPKNEVPLCGHATLAAHFVHASLSSQPTGQVTQLSPGGQWDVRWHAVDGEYTMTMRQAPVQFEGPLDDTLVERLLAALGVGRDALVPEWPVDVISTGHAKVMVPIRDLATLRSLTPRLDALAAVSGEIGVGGNLLFTTATGDSRFLTECRMFGPAIGVPEDPVNGSGHGPLAAYLWARGVLTAERSEFESRMGETMGRPGEVDVELFLEDDTPVAADVSGKAVLAFEADIRL